MFLKGIRQPFQKLFLFYGLQTLEFLSMSFKIINFKNTNGHTLNYMFITLFHKQIKQKLFRKSVRLNSIFSPSNVLSQENRVKCINLLQSLKPIGMKSIENLKKAAVLVPLCEVNRELGFLYIVRATHLKTNGGEVAFPGGMVDDSDKSLEAAALRETFEEIGIHPSNVNVWGKGPNIDRGNVCVTPFLGYVGALDSTALKINHSEVSMVFVVSLEHLSSEKNFRTTKFRLPQSNFLLLTPVYIEATKRIWGLTAYITHLILSCLIPEQYNKNIKFQTTAQKIKLSKKIT